jgi:hypothetical protein
MSVLSVVDIEAALKAGHSVEPESDTQLCANTVGAVARIESNAVLALKVIVRRFRLRVPSLALLRLDDIVAVSGHCRSSMLKQLTS